MSSPPRQRIVISKKEACLEGREKSSDVSTQCVARENSSCIPASHSTSSESRIVSPRPIQFALPRLIGFSSSAPHANFS